MRNGRFATFALGSLVGGLAAALVTTSVIYAHGGDGSLIHGCINANGGLRITGAPGYGNPNTGCAGGETAVDWSQTGPPGPAGPAGPAGAGGPPGAPGPAPTTGDIAQALRTTGLPRQIVRVVTASSAPANRNYVNTVTAFCPAEHPLALSGGLQVAPRRLLPPLTQSTLSEGRVVSGGRQGWSASVQRHILRFGSVLRSRPGAWTLTVTATCAASS